jgi:hypothetical protein
MIRRSIAARAHIDPAYSTPSRSSRIPAAAAAAAAEFHNGTQSQVIVDRDPRPDRVTVCAERATTSDDATCDSIGGRRRPAPARRGGPPRAAAALPPRG